MTIVFGVMMRIELKKKRRVLELYKFHLGVLDNLNKLHSQH